MSPRNSLRNKIIAVLVSLVAGRVWRGPGAISASPNARIAQPLEVSDVISTIFPNGRAPDDVRRMLSSYQQAAHRGRADAERSLTGQPPASPSGMADNEGTSS